MASVNAVYLDHNATTPPVPEAVEAMLEAMALIGANPSSVHGFGREARKRIEAARQQVADLVGASPEGVFFTSGGTEANNTVIEGAERGRVLFTATEHAAVLKTALLKTRSPEIIAVDDQGVIDLAALETLLKAKDEPSLVCVMAANNETGVLQPIAEVAALAHRYGALVHCDAVQAAGKIPVDAVAWGVDYLTLSAHKLGGPQGMGAVIRIGDAPLRGMLTGGGQERGMRAGTENVAGIVGFGVAAQLARERQPEKAARMSQMRDRLEAKLIEIAPQTKIFSGTAPRLPNTSNFTLAGVRSDTQVMALDMEGVAVSAGSACSAGRVEPSHVLDAMGVDPDEAITAIRISLGWNSRDEDVDRFLDVWGSLRGRAETDVKVKEIS